MTDRHRRGKSIEIFDVVLDWVSTRGQGRLVAHLRLRRSMRNKRKTLKKKQRSSKHSVELQAIVQVRPRTLSWIIMKDLGQSSKKTLKIKELEKVWTPLSFQSQRFLVESLHSPFRTLRGFVLCDYGARQGFAPAFSQKRKALSFSFVQHSSARKLLRLELIK